MNNISIDFNDKCNQNNWLNFLKSDFLPDDFEPQEEDIEIDFNTTYIKKVTLIGLCNSLSLKVYEIHHESENDPRVSISRESFRVMASYGVKRALILFVSATSNNYRFSLITLDLHLEGKKVIKLFSNPHRYSYFLGPEAKIHTPYQYLVSRGRIKEEKDLLNRFSIEVVNKEFYEKIALLFTKLTGGIRKVGNRNIEFEPLLKLPSMQDHETLQRFGVRLIGRIIFCWFLKKKKSQNNIPIIPDEILSLNAIKKNYYHSILEPLFFEVLNTPIGKRKSFIKQEKKWENIPFLNGGLFDPNLHQDFYQIDDTLGKYLHLNTLKIPDNWFKEFFEILETYNFTIDENTSVDIDLSVEPEMLGRIFENLLAEINPDTQKTARKATGSYYTPRPIVEYMVDESLIQYLLTKLKSFGIVENLPNGFKDVENSNHCEGEKPFARSELEQKIRNLLDYTIEETELSDKEKSAVIDALDEVKVLDPACGSGAFPMGMLQKMLLILQKVDPQSLVWLIKQLDKIPNPMIRKSVEDELMNKNWDYIHKMGLIQHSIYGVDIQPIAVELSKLRFFLTLMVDEDINDKAENRGINPLPNLSFKFVTANSLIGLPKKVEIDLMDRAGIDKKIKELKKVRDDFFFSYGGKKDNLEKRYEQIQNEMFGIYLKSQSTNELALKLIGWKPFTDEKIDWFDSKWMFGIKGGFDIVIANPPYVSVKMIPKKEKQIYSDLFISGKGRLNLFTIFLEKGHNLLKTNGILTYIIPEGFYSHIEYRYVRDYIIDNTVILFVNLFSDRVFDAAVDTTILSIMNNKYRDNHFYVFRDLNNRIYNLEQRIIYKFPYHIFPVNLTVMSKSIILKLLSGEFLKIRNILEIQQGIIYSGQTKEKVFSNYKKDDRYKKVLDGRDVLKWKINWIKKIDNKYICYTHRLHRSREERLFINKEKLLLPRKSTKISCAFDNKQFYALNTAYVCLNKNRKFSLKFILGCLNSKLINYLYSNLFWGWQVTIPALNSIPIPDVLKDIQQTIISLVDQILKRTQLEDYLQNIEKQVEVKKLENQIDIIVYKLYGLTYDDVKIVDPEFDTVLASVGINKKDFEQMNVDELGERFVKDVEELNE